MGAALLYKTLYGAWIVTEVLVYLRTRTSRKTGEVRDRGSMITMWITVTVALTAGGWLGAIHPLFMFNKAPWVRWLSLVVFAAGLGIRWAAIAALGRAFSANVAIHAGQTLRTTGLFSAVRHPSYTGLAMIFLALALYPTNWTYFAIVLLPTMAALLYRIHVEEEVLGQAFGLEYREYRRRTRRLLPFVY